MKQYSRKVSEIHSESLSLLKTTTKEMFENSIMDSKTFAQDWEPFIRDLGLVKEANGKRYYRSQEYSSIGVMDRNDLIQEAYTCFLEVWSKIDWKKVNELPEAEQRPYIWSWVKKSTMRRINDNILALKDGIRIPHRELYYESYKDRKQTREGGNLNNITSLFNHLERVFEKNEAETAITKWETDLLGYFLETKLDDYLDMKSGKRNMMGIEREVIKRFYGIDNPVETLKEIGDYYKKDASTMRKVKQRALDKLKNDDLKIEISEFCKEYFIKTQADI